MTRIEDWHQPEQKTFAAADLSWLSQSTQNFFQPIDCVISKQEALPWTLDFGTGADLYQLPAYTGERLSARAIMADDAEQKLDAPKIQAPSDAVARPSVIQTKEDEAIWDKMQEPHKLGKHESATHIGLSPEVIAEMQKKGQASKLEFFDSAAEGALAALQNPPTEQVLLASNITRNFQNVEKAKQVDPVGEVDRQLTAQTFEYNGGLPTLVPSPEQLGLDQIWHAADRLQHHVKHRFRGYIGETMKEIPDQAWSDAYKQFPQFKEAGLTEKQTTELMQAIARNELYFYDLGDALDDKSMRETGKPVHYPFKDRRDGAATLGVSQVSVDGVKKFEGEFPSQMGRYLGHEAEALLDPREAPMMIAAVLAHNIKDFKGHYPINEQTLAYSFNPDVLGEKGKKPPTAETLKQSEHYANVMRQLAIIRGQVQPKPDEH